MPEATQMGLAELYSSSILEVPRYQRNYSWRTQQIQDLLDDLEYIYDENYADGNSGEADPNIDIHYFGEIVIQKVGTETTGDQEFTSYEVVDGQQRLLTVPLLVRSILTRANKLEYEPGKQERELLENAESVYLSIEGLSRITPSNDDEGVYEDLVSKNFDVEDSDINLPSHRYLQMAKNNFEEYLEEEIEERELEDQDAYAFLFRLIYILSKDFTITRFTIEETKEAGRFFETKNDRGRDLTIKDKIKSYLIYCASRLNDEDLSREIFRTFSELTSEIADPGNEKAVDTFLKSHWRMFSGEEDFSRTDNHEINELHRRIKQVADHARLDRENGSLQSWIEAYLDSLRKSSEAYARVRYPNKLADDIRTDAEDGDRAEDIIDTLSGIRACSSTTNVGALLMAANIKFGFNDRFLDIISDLEKFAFRAYMVSGASARAKRMELNRLAHNLIWTGNAETGEGIFSTSRDDLADRYYSDAFDSEDIYDDLDQAYYIIRDAIESAIGNYGNRSNFESSLARRDVLEGNDQDDNWNGIEKKAFPFLFYRYEKQNRPPRFSSVPDWNEWDSNVHRVNVWDPDSTDLGSMVAEKYEGVKRRIGNFTIVEQDKNKTENTSYAEAHEEVFGPQSFDSEFDTPELNAGPFQLLTELPTPETSDSDEENDSPEISTEDLDELTNKYIEFATDYWGLESRAHICVTEWDISKDKNEIKRQVAKEVRNDYFSQSDEFSYNIPNVTFSDTAEMGDEWSIEGVDDSEDANEDDLKLKIKESEGVISYALPEVDSDLESTDPRYTLHRTHYRNIKENISANDN